MRGIAVIAKDRCVGCTQCKLTCRFQAIVQEGARCRVISEGCTRCGQCIWVCPLSAISEDDRRQTVR